MWCTIIVRPADGTTVMHLGPACSSRAEARTEVSEWPARLARAGLLPWDERSAWDTLDIDCGIITGPGVLFGVIDYERPDQLPGLGEAWIDAVLDHPPDHGSRSGRPMTRHPRVGAR